MSSTSSVWRAEARTLAALSWPVVLGQLGFVLFGVVDTFFTGQVSREALAAVSLGNIYSFGVAVFGMGVVRGFDPFFSQSHGAGQRASGALALWRAMALAIALAIPMTALHLVPEPIMRLLGQPEATIPIAAEYCRAVAPSILPFMIFAALAQFLQGLGKMRPPMVIVLLGNALNIVLDAVLVTGVPEWGIPAGGAHGCGVATTVVRWGMTLGLCAITYSVMAQYRPPSWREVLRIKPLGHMLTHGVPVGIQSGLEGWAFGVLGVLMGVLGEVELAAHAVAINVVATMFMIPFGIGAAAATRVGNLVGADANARWHTTAWLAIGAATLWMIGSSVVLLIFGRDVATWFTSDPAVIAVVVGLMPVAAAFQIFDGVQAATFGVLRGAGDTRWPALANVIGYWLIGLPLGWWLGVKTYADARILWGGVALALAIVSTIVLIRLKWIMRRGAYFLFRE